MNIKRFVFMLYGLAPQIIKVKQLNRPIHHFWHTVQENYQSNGFFDVSGNIFIKKQNTSYEMLYPNISHLNSFGDYNKYKLLSYESHNDYRKKSLILWNDGFEEFNWCNTTLLEYINGNEYRRVDFFGNVFYKNIFENSTRYNSFSFIKNEFFQKLFCINDYSFSVNNFNLFYIHHLNTSNKIKIIYSECLPTFHPIRKLDVKKYGNFYHCYIWNNNNEMSIYVFVELANEFKFINRNFLNLTEENIIDIAFDNGYLFLGLRNKIVIYNYSTVDDKISKVTERKFEFPYYTEIFLDSNILYLNNQNYISFIKIDTNYYKSSQYTILPFSP